MTVLGDQLETHEAHIGGCSLRLKSRQDPATFKEIVQMVEERVRSSRDGCRFLSMREALALSCLNMAGELMCLKKALLGQLDDLESSVRHVLSEVESFSVDERE